MDEIKDIIRSYKGRQTWDEMVEYINRTPRLAKPIKRAAVNMWGIGNSVPDYYFLTHLQRYSNGWVSRMAEDILKVMCPEVWE